MDFKDQFKQLSERVPKLKEQILIVIFAPDKTEIEHQINSLDDIYQYQDEIIKSASNYL